jgi:hypothetical protein
MDGFRDPKRFGVKLGCAILAGLTALVLIGIISVLAIVPAVSPATGAQVADLIRAAVGPRPVAALESGSFAIQDAVNRFMSTQNGGKIAISLAQMQGRAQGPAAPAETASGAVTLATTPWSGSDAVSAPPGIGWQAVGPLVNGSPVMAQALLTLDPQRAYAGVALVRIDLSQLKLHMMPGFLEPSHTKDVVTAFPNLGLTPAADRANLIAGFNGGFKAVNGQYGMMVNGVTILPPLPGVATVALYRDGHVAMGVWGQDILPSPDIVAFRQNCPPIVQNGQVSPQVFVENRLVWGDTIGNQEITWRTGLGLTQDGRYLIYAVGNGTTVATLAQALEQAGAYSAMQLDINRHYAHFVTYQATGSGTTPLKAVQLLDQMESDPTLYLVAHSRDYFYLTTK